jgi:hypothetical protein
MGEQNLERHQKKYRADAHRLPPGDWAHEFEYRAFDAKKAAKLLDLIAGGLSQKKACEAMNHTVTRKTIQIWALRSPGFAAGLEQAMRIRWHLLADEMLEIADDASGDYRQAIEVVHGKKVQVKVADPLRLRRDQLRIATIKWALYHGLPDRYGSLVGMGPPEKPVDAPAWLKLCSPETQLRVAKELARARAEGESRLIEQEPADDDRDSIDAA